MSYTLCFDFGNTRKKVAVFHHKKIKDILHFTENEYDFVKNIVVQYPKAIKILSSVVYHDIKIDNELKKEGQFYLLNHLTPLPFYAAYHKKETMGTDRLALIAGCLQYRLKKHNYLVISLGTCITYNFMNSEKMFLGGSISPGVEMRFKAMHHHTALLPLINWEEEFPLIGYDTKTNILSGVILGVQKEIDGIIEEYKKKYINITCILTGGDCNFFVKRLKNKIFADPQLLFKGLYEILQYQKK